MFITCFKINIAIKYYKVSKIKLLSYVKFDNKPILSNIKAKK